MSSGKRKKRIRKDWLLMSWLAAAAVALGLFLALGMNACLLYTSLVVNAGFFDRRQVAVTFRDGVQHDLQEEYQIAGIAGHHHIVGCRKRPESLRGRFHLEYPGVFCVNGVPRCV